MVRIAAKKDGAFRCNHHGKVRNRALPRGGVPEGRSYRQNKDEALDSISDTVPELPLSGMVQKGTVAHRELSALIAAHRFSRPAAAILKLEGEISTSSYFLISGWMALSKTTEDGSRQIIDIVLPGEILGPWAADAKARAVQIEALCPVKYAAIPREKWLKLRQTHIKIRAAVDRMIAAALSRLSERMLRLGKGSAESIIAFALFELCLRSTRGGVAGGEAFHIPMTQQQLGDFCGLSAVHVCRTLRRFERNGFLAVANHMDITLRDVDALAEIAGIDPDTLQQEIIPAA
ncbi:Crp/Fnr family transcriptional regulator [Maribius pontilimi]|uniref:Crp/Fnr family transcriptional regulator n=1 Tax=Palleronia pontilimi TaxID=1964209 RepID=A0A934I8X6_9RHOB|nr:Crp/Fnr family transcriptional regulator [Palleronia pontilimi]MBJ3762533.1 Crp/Fnr family transcriptional regulator [Palleronia pontilimi]